MSIYTIEVVFVVVVVVVVVGLVVRWLSAREAASSALLSFAPTV